MSVGTPPKALLKAAPDVTLCPARVEPAAETGLRVYVLLPTLDELLGHPGFGRANPIFLPGHARPLDGWALFGPVRNRGIDLH